MKTLGAWSRFFPTHTLGGGDAQGLIAYLDLGNVFTVSQQINGNVTAVSSDSGAASGPFFIADRASASPAAADDIGGLILAGRDSGGNSTSYCYLVGNIKDPTNGSEDGAARLQALVAGVDTQIMAFGPGVQVGAPTGGDPGYGGINVGGTIKVNGVAVSGGITVRQGRTNFTTYQTVTTVMPNDDTAPQITEGVELATLVVTPRSASSILRIRIGLAWSTNGVTISPVVAVFVDATATAIAATTFMSEVSTTVVNSSMYEWEIAAGSTSARTYRLRVGPGTAGSIFVNGDSVARQLSGLLQTFLSVEEVLP